MPTRPARPLSSPAGPAAARIAHSTASLEGDANTPPHTAALSIPAPTKPACAGSWPLPPPQMTATCDLSHATLHTTLMSCKGGVEGYGRRGGGSSAAIYRSLDLARSSEEARAMVGVRAHAVAGWSRAWPRAAINRSPDLAGSIAVAVAGARAQADLLECVQQCHLGGGRDVALEHVGDAAGRRLVDQHVAAHSAWIRRDCARRGSCKLEAGQISGSRACARQTAPAGLSVAPTLTWVGGAQTCGGARAGACAGSVPEGSRALQVTNGKRRATPWQARGASVALCACDQPALPTGMRATR